MFEVKSTLYTIIDQTLAYDATYNINIAHRKPVQVRKLEQQVNIP